MRASSSQDPADVGLTLGPLGAEVMRAVWRLGPANVGAVRDALNGDRARPLAYTTVLTILVRLRERGIVVRERQGRHDLYRARQDEAATVASMRARAVDAIVERYGTGAFREFAVRMSDLDPELRHELIDLVEGADEQAGGRG